MAANQYTALDVCARHQTVFKVHWRRLACFLVLL